MKRALDDSKDNSLDYVASLESPMGIYLRQAIFPEAASSDAALKEKLHDKISAGQSTDGSWNQLFVRTADNLWNLALMGYKAEEACVQKGLEWLLLIQRAQYKGHPGFFLSDNRQDPRLMRQKLYGEFGPGCTIFYQTTYAIHLFHIFGFHDHQRIEKTIRSYLGFWRPDWCGAWCTINVLRVLIEHPLSMSSEQVEDGVKYLAERQGKLGAWKGFPFYHTFHALSRSKSIAARQQLKKASALVVQRQNMDGSWGRKEQETATFLVLDALRNAGAT
jgi:hypothetical protein